MSEAEFDFAVFGATPLAHLLAGLLATAHGRKVMLVGEGQAGYRLIRGIDLSVAPMTRPESWAMLGHSVPEAARLISRIAGRSGLSRVDPIFFAEGRQDSEALSHMRHMALGFGIAAEPAAPSLLGEGRAGLVLRDAMRINRPALEHGLDRWLQQGSVLRLVPQSVSIGLDGPARVVADGVTYLARQAILADDEALMTWLPLKQWPTLLRRTGFASILTTPTRPLAASVMLELNSGVFLTQQAEGGIAGFGPGDLAHFSAHLQALLGRDRQVEQAGQTSFHGLMTLDGAPTFGRVAGVGADVVAGLGCAGAFVAPALARWLAGAASPSEAAWFGGRLINRSGKAAPVGDYAPGLARLSA